MKYVTSPVSLALFAAIATFAPVQAASLTDGDVRLMVRAIGFLRPQPGDNAIVAIAYAASDPTSRQDAEAIASYFGTGLKTGSVNLRPHVMDERQLAAGGIVAIITASGTNVTLVAAVARTLHVPCVTGDVAQVRSGRCAVSVRSTPKVEITVSRAVTVDSEVSFASAFLMMVNLF